MVQGALDAVGLLSPVPGPGRGSRGFVVVGPAARCVVLLGALFLSAVAGGCEGSGERPGVARGAAPMVGALPAGQMAVGAPFPGSATSLAELGETVLRALVRGDTAALERVRLTEREHNEVVWPELPASAPEINFPVDFAWENIQLRNRRALGRVLPWFHGRDVEPGTVRCRGEVQAFRTFRVLTDCVVGLSTPGAGALEVRLFKDVLVRGGGYKIFRYYEDPPRPVTAP